MSYDAPKRRHMCVMGSNSASYQLKTFHGPIYNINIHFYGYNTSGIQIKWCNCVNIAILIVGVMTRHFDAFGVIFAFPPQAH